MEPGVEESGNSFVCQRAPRSPILSNLLLLFYPKVVLQNLQALLIGYSDIHTNSGYVCLFLLDLAHPNSTRRADLVLASYSGPGFAGLMPQYKQVVHLVYTPANHC